jgi:hypothetical protein
MIDDKDEAHIRGQLAGLIAVMSAFADGLLAATRDRELRQMEPQFEAPLKAIGGTRDHHTDAEREAAQWIRDLFTKKLQATKKASKSGRSPPTKRRR